MGIARRVPCLALEGLLVADVVVTFNPLEPVTIVLYGRPFLLTSVFRFTTTDLEHAFRFLDGVRPLIVEGKLEVLSVSG